METGVVVTPAAINVLNAFKETGHDTGGTWNVKLFKNDLEPSKETVAGDFIEAAFGGYGAATLTITLDAQIDEDGDAQLVAPSATFASTSAVPDEVVYGFYVEDGNDELMMAGRFADAPIPMEDAGLVIQLALRLRAKELQAAFEVTQ